MQKTNSPDNSTRSNAPRWPDRICLVRHYPYVPNEAYLEFERIVDAKFWYALSEAEKARIAKLETQFVRKKHFEELTEYMRKRLEAILGSQEKPPYLCYEENGTDREIETAHDLIRKFEIPPERVIKIDMPEHYRQNGAEYFERYRKRINSILVSLSEKERPAWTVAIVWRRSDAAAFLWYPPRTEVDVRDARNFLESEAVISIELDGRAPDADMSVYELIAMASKKLNSRQAKKAVCRELFQINGETVFDPYTSLRVGDVVRFKNRNYEMLMEKDGTIGIWRTVFEG